MRHGDLISRQAVLDAIMANNIWENEYNLTSSRIKKAVENLPTVKPQPQAGHWIAHQEGRWIYAECSECRGIHDTISNYCPSCGCLMDRNDFDAYFKANI